MKGWIPAWRKLFEREDWLRPTAKHPAGKREAWLDLCQMAQHEDYDHGGEPLKRGEVMVSLSHCEKRWAWSRRRVRWFLDRLSCDTMIGIVRGTPSGTIYSIVNYDTYAVGEMSQGHSQRHSQRHSNGTATAPEQEGRREHTKKTRANKSRLPEGWKPTDQHRERAKSEGVNCDAQAERFREWHLAKGSLFVDWNRAFTTWLLRANDFARPNGNGSQATIGGFWS